MINYRSERQINILFKMNEDLNIEYNKSKSELNEIRSENLEVNKYYEFFEELNSSICSVYAAFKRNVPRIYKQP